ncbi:ubiquinone/menaquinone biosynthesis C-methylase UbiE [Phycicoccus badiiscoriae]|uniref:Ubiquinone/menaquinone biosynthesis C-methylase UbiE n=1 Tax=Pedococcus badiiscoriae TaxID=642776 RepID=A0A852WL78_9MICO|nr:class I SAM-dependent methyltransferase [Pedococcus badiiscoriae]NYG07524.1 ubiquinone/menaquinone biosynthesis C-methylase UbiE [Pedococcus badiiscoriae]
MTTQTSGTGITDTDEDRALKARHSAMWALGNYPAVAADIIGSLGPIVVDAAGITAGHRVHDVAAGSGNVAIPAARTGAHVTATDLTPELLEKGRQDAEAEGLAITWRVADAEHLPFGDGEFDAVTSCVGVMFAPHHQLVADELVRTCRPGGTIALLSWTPEGFIGQMFAAMKPYAAPPPPGAQPPPLWGHVDHVRELFGERVEGLTARQQDLVVDQFATPEEFRDFFKTNYGPTIAVYKAIADDPDKVAALDRDLVALAQRFDRGDGHTVLDWEYLLVTAQRV